MVRIADALKAVVDDFPTISYNGKEIEVAFLQGTLLDMRMQLEQFLKGNKFPAIVWLLRDYEESESLGFYKSSVKVWLLIDTLGNINTPARLEDRIIPILRPLQTNIINGLGTKGVFVESPAGATERTYIGNQVGDVKTSNLFQEYVDGIELTLKVSVPTQLQLIECNT